MGDLARHGGGERLPLGRWSARRQQIAHDTAPSSEKLNRRVTRAVSRRPTMQHRTRCRPYVCFVQLMRLRPTSLMQSRYASTCYASERARGVQQRVSDARRARPKPSTRGQKSTPHLTAVLIVVHAFRAVALLHTLAQDLQQAQRPARLRQRSTKAGAHVSLRRRVAARRRSAHGGAPLRSPP